MSLWILISGGLPVWKGIVGTTSAIGRSLLTAE